MNKLSKLFILSIILIFLSVSFANASEIDSDDMKYSIDDNGIEEISIDDVSLNEEQEDQSIVSNFNQISENEDNNLNYDNELVGESSDNTLLSAESSGNIHKVSPTNYTKYFKNGYVDTSIVKSGDIIDLSGNFNKRNFTFTIPCSITSSQKNAYLTNCVVKYENVSSTIYSNVSNLRFRVDIEKHPCVYIVYSSHVNVFNCDAYSTGANSNPTLLVGSTYCNIHDNVFETTFTGYMNMSWKRAGILLGESHYNNIYSNHVTVKDSNPIYLTTYGFEKSNYNNIYNNTVTTSAVSELTGLPNPSAWAYGVHIMGDYNTVINNTIYKLFRGIDSEGSFNQIIGNKIYNLSGSYYEGNNGTDGGEYGIHASYNDIIINNTIYDSKITGAAIYVAVNNTVEGNLISNIEGAHGIELGYTSSNSLVSNNSISLISGNGIYLRGTLVNVTLSNNIVGTRNGTAIIIKKQTNSKNPDNITILNNILLEINEAFINYSDVESKANITLFNNSAIVVKDSFFKIFDSNGDLKDVKLDNLIFKGDFADLDVPYINLNKSISIIGQNSNIYNIPFLISSDNIKIENLTLSLDNQKDAFKLNNAQNVSFFNNTVTINSENFALVLNNSKLNIADNIITINADNPAILNDNGSYILFDENIIRTLNDLEIQSLHDSTVKYVFYILTDENFDELFNSNGIFRDDFDISIGDNLRIANLTNKTFRIDIPLVITAFQESVLNNCTIILEDGASNTNISNLRFKLENNEINKDFSFIIIKDGISNLIIENNQFDLSNIVGELSLSAIKIIGSDESAENIRLLGNNFNLSADLNSISAISTINELLYNYDDITDALTIIGNNISIANSREDGAAYGINMVNSKNLKISSNNISVIGDTVFGLYLNKISKSNIVNNVIYENNAYVNIIHSNNPTKDIQNAIDCSIGGDTIYLGDGIYSIKDSLIINKSISIVGGILLDNIDSGSNQLISNDDPLFVISPSNAQITVNFLNMTVILDNNDLFALSKLTNSSNSIDILYPIVNIKGNAFLKNNDDVDERSICLVKSIAERPFFKSMENINLEDNDLIENMEQLNCYLFNDSNEINFKNGAPSILSANNLVCTALEKSIYGNSVKYFKVRLSDENNNSLSNKSVYISYNNMIYNLITDSNGVASLPVSINAYGIYTILISFFGDYEHCASFTSSKLTVNKQKVSLIVPNKSYLISSTKYLTATFKDINGKLIKNKKISFILSGKTYSAYTNSKGVAKVKVKASIAKTYTVTVKFAGNNVYSPISKTLKLYVKKVPTKLIVANKYYRKSTKTKKLIATLKTKSGKAIAKKKLTFIFNGKKYTVYTNSKGVATVKVKVSLRKTYRFTVKFAGDGTYLKTSKTAKLIIK